MRQVRASCAQLQHQPRNLCGFGLLVLLFALTLFTGFGCQEKPSTEINEKGEQATSNKEAGTSQQPGGIEPEVVSGLGLRLELRAESFEGSSFRVHGVPQGYQVWAPVTDGSFEKFLIFNAEGVHVASILVRYEPKQSTRVAPMERYRLHFEVLSEFPVWQAQVTTGQAPAAGLTTEFTDGRFDYIVTTRGEERWLLDGWVYKSTEALRCFGPEMCPQYECLCGYDPTGRPYIATGERLACIDGRCVAPEPCDEFCLSIDFTEHDIH